VAILKSVMGSTSQDRFPFEYCFGIRMPDGTALGTFIGERVRKLGLEYHDFWPYLREHGWLNEE
jgi:hypothetical protein